MEQKKLDAPAPELASQSTSTNRLKKKRSSFSRLFFMIKRLSTPIKMRPSRSSKRRIKKRPIKWEVSEVVREKETAKPQDPAQLVEDILEIFRKSPVYKAVHEAKQKEKEKKKKNSCSSGKKFTIRSRFILILIV